MQKFEVLLVRERVKVGSAAVQAGWPRCARRANGLCGAVASVVLRVLWFCVRGHKATKPPNTITRPSVVVFLAITLVYINRLQYGTPVLRGSSVPPRAHTHESHAFSRATRDFRNKVFLKPRNFDLDLVWSPAVGLFWMPPH
jgi:hypothetical protein